MTDADCEAIRELAKLVPDLRPFNIIAPSGESMEQELIEELWGATMRAVPRSEWDLDFPAPAYLRRFDMVLLCNTFLCSEDPAAWLARLAVVSDTVLIQDLACAPRGQGRITDRASGDVSRYSVSSHGIIGRTDPEANPVFDFSTSGAGVIAAVPYFHLGDGVGKFAVLLDLRPLRIDVG